jgi:hypothetical protein
LLLNQGQKTLKHRTRRRGVSKTNESSAARLIKYSLSRQGRRQSHRLLSCRDAGTGPRGVAAFVPARVPTPFPSLSLALRCMRRGEGESSDPSRSRSRCSWPLVATARDELSSRPRARTVVCGLINWLRFPAVETRTASAERKACCLRRGRRCAAASIVHRWPRRPAGACEDQIAHRRDCEKGHAL